MGYYGDFESQEHEDYERRRLMEDDRDEPNVVPCFVCGAQMYEKSPEPSENLCSDCEPKHPNNKEEL